MRHKTKLWITVAALGAAYMSSLAPGAQAATVCNEAENSHRGGYVVSGGTVDPNPPARHTADVMRVGNDNARGLDNAADHSPALRQCGPEGEPTGTGGDTGGGGDDGGVIIG
jgi:hypothetical protein